MHRATPPQNSSIRRDHRFADGKDALEPKSFRTVTAARPCRTLPQRMVGGARPSVRIVTTIGRSRRSVGSQRLMQGPRFVPRESLSVHKVLGVQQESMLLGPFHRLY